MLASTIAKILIVVTSHGQLGTTGKTTGYFLPEVTHTTEALEEKGFTVHIASPKGGKAPMDETSKDMKDPINKKLLGNKEFVNKLENTLKLSDVGPQEYSAIIFTGGHGTMWDFPDNKELAKLASTIYERGGVVGAICHGPAALVNIKLTNGDYLIKGKKVGAFSNKEEKAVGLDKVVPFLLETKLKERGAVYSEAPIWQKHVVIDDRLVTGQNPASAMGVGESIAAILLKKK